MKTTKGLHAWYASHSVVTPITAEPATMASPATTAPTVARRRGNILNIGVVKVDESLPPFIF